jgi:hypothetical protein
MKQIPIETKKEVDFVRSKDEIEYEKYVQFCQSDDVAPAQYFWWSYFRTYL